MGLGGECARFEFLAVESSSSKMAKVLRLKSDRSKIRRAWLSKLAPNCSNYQMYSGVIYALSIHLLCPQANFSRILQARIDRLLSAIARDCYSHRPNDECTCHF